MNPFTPVPRDENGHKHVRIYSIAHEQREALCARDDDGRYLYELDPAAKPPQDSLLVEEFDDPRRQARCYVYSHPSFEIVREGAQIAEYYAWIVPCNV